MIWALVALLWIALTGCLASIDVTSLQHDFKNLRVIRNVDLSTSIVKETIGIRAKNTGSTPTDTYYFLLPASTRLYLSYYKAYLKQDLKGPLVMEDIGLDVSKQFQTFKIYLNKILEPDMDIKIGIDLSLTHLIRPYPEKQPQVSFQHVQYQDNIFILSPYPIDDIKTTFEFPSKDIVSFKGGEPDHQGVLKLNKIVYDGFKNIKPLTVERCGFYYVYTQYIPTVTELKRELEVSHWYANLAVKEAYAIRHDGAQLDKPFSRVEYSRSDRMLPKTFVWNKLALRLPKEATEVYYRDEVGNVSSSHFRSMYTVSILELEPRFPLFGGWKTTFDIFYNVPITNYLRKFAGKHLLKVKFLEYGGTMTFDQVELKVILPEGASHVEVETPNTFKMDSIDHSIHYTYFDSTGRPVVTLRKGNVVADHEQYVVISYKYTRFNLLQKPVVASVGIFFLCLLSILVAKIPWSLQDINDVEEEKFGSVIVQPPFYVKGAVLIDEKMSDEQILVEKHEKPPLNIIETVPVKFRKKKATLH